MTFYSFLKSTGNYEFPFCPLDAQSLSQPSAPSSQFIPFLGLLSFSRALNTAIAHVLAVLILVHCHLLSALMF